jgi:hypothetical protein
MADKSFVIWPFGERAFAGIYRSVDCRIGSSGEMRSEREASSDIPNLSTAATAMASDDKCAS